MSGPIYRLASPPAGDDLFRFKVMAFKLGRACIEVLDRELNPLVDGNSQFRRREFMLVKAQLEVIVGALCGEARQEPSDNHGK